MAASKTKEHIPHRSLADGCRVPDSFIGDYRNIGVCLFAVSTKFQIVSYESFDKFAVVTF